MKNKKIDYLGKGNPNYRHGGYLPYLMSIEEEDRFKEIFKEYVTAHPRLLQPATRDILKRAIIFKIRIDRLDNYIEDLTIDEANRRAAEKLQESLVKTWMTLLMRCGLLYTPQQYISKEEKGRVLSPEDLLKIKQAKRGKKKDEKEEEAECQV